MSGFRKPSDGLPALMRASFRSETIPAKAGDAADVPSAKATLPLKKTRKFSDCAATSGMPWSDVLSLPHSMLYT